ncbi:helix-turn-helix domain-containing protein [Vagococcus intermedius]|uniref:Helix-turn-helix domain-containing protein n=1 Tax=Vagococcus intermedius TaxID=2991418 RepID=A0AAF0CVA0_9ENTE|nr:helix-turn-helix domain-containing protein [Vagococcus intermedius]WEG73595.1 helix-turn-helix domain-containing protein [Vagococcus intermedius]WEG75679.1 helix-turn-helix domain-containing protein [Vagococcus intermedius]
MLDLLIKKNEYNQIVILGSAISECTLPKDILEKKLDLTSFTLTRYIRNINTDIQEFDTSKSVFVTIKGDTICLNNPNDLPIYTLFNQILSKFLNESTVYQTLKALLFRNKQATDTLIDSLNISQSYFNKIIKSINEYFTICEVQIIQRNKQIFFSGPETHILFLEFLIRQYFNKIETLPCICKHQFPDLIDLVRDHTLSDLNSIQLSRMNELHHIFKKRSEHLTNIKIMDPEIKEALETITSLSDLIVDTPDIPNYSQDMRLFSNLLPRVMSSQLETPATKRQIGMKLAKSRTNFSKDVVTFVNTIIERFIDNMDLNSNEYFEFIYIAHLHLIYARLFGSDFKILFKLKHAHIFDLAAKDQPVYNELVTYFNNPNNFSDINTVNKVAIISNRALFIDSTYTAIRSYRYTSVTISFDFMYRLSFEYFLQNRLRDIFSESALIFTHNSDKTDIIVTDHIIKVPQDTKLFTFVDTNSSQSLDNLLAMITKTFNHKIMATEA